MWSQTARLRLEEARGVGRWDEGGRLQEGDEGRRLGRVGGRGEGGGEGGRKGGGSKGTKDY